MKSNYLTDKRLTRTQQARRSDIIEAAVKVIDTEGFAAASVDRIAQAADTSKSTALYHFATKESIYDSVIGSLYQQGEDYMGAKLVAATDAPERLRIYLDANLRFIATHAAHVHAVHLILENRFSSYSLPDGITPLCDILRDGQVSGDFGVFDPEIMALAIRSVIDGFSFHIGEQSDLEHRIGEIIALFSRSVTGNKEPSCRSKK